MLNYVIHLITFVVGVFAGLVLMYLLMGKWKRQSGSLRSNDKRRK